MKIFGRVSLGLVFVASSNAFPFAKWFKRQTLADMSSGKILTTIRTASAFDYFPVDILNYALTLEHLGLFKYFSACHLPLTNSGQKLHSTAKA